MEAVYYYVDSVCEIGIFFANKNIGSYEYNYTMMNNLTNLETYVYRCIIRHVFIMYS